MRLSVLGTVELRVGGEPIDLGQRMERCLLGVLALDPGQPVPTGRLIELLWGGNPPASPRSALQVHVSRLRKRLAAAPAFRLTRRGDGYALDADPAAVDACELRRLAAEARAAEDLTARAALLEQAGNLGTGPLFGEAATEAVAEQFRPAYEELALSVTELRLETQLALGAHHEQLPELAELTARHPLRERFAELYMLALYRSGRRADALDAYHRAGGALRGELGLSPGPALENLHVAILRDDPALAAPEREVPSRPAPAQLPPAIGDFTGREPELSELDGLLPHDEEAPSGLVLVSTVAGTGGVGKTALVLHWAHRVRDRFPGGQLFLNLHGYSHAPALSPLEGLSRFLRALGVPAEEVPLDLDEAAALYRTLMGGRQVLVVLDNAGSAEQVRPLLPGSPGSLAVVTSRDRMAGLVARDGARRMNLGVLSPAESAALLSRLLGPGRVAREPEAAAELAGLCGHLPLALRVTAAYLADEPGLSLAGHAATLRDGSRLTALELEGDEPSSIRAAFGLSYEKLPAQASELFGLLGLVPGPDFTAQTAAALAGTEPGHAVQLLDRLAAAHLVEDTGGGRYALHDLLREYAAEKATGSTEPLRGLSRHYLGRAAAAAELLYPQMLRLPVPAEPDVFAGPPAALSWLDTELPGLLAMIRSDGAEVAWLLADLLRGYFYTRSDVVSWQAAATAGLAAATAAGDLRGQAAGLMSLGLLRLCTGDLAQAMPAYERAASLSREDGWLAGEAAAQGNLGHGYFITGDMPAAEACLTRALELNRATGQRNSEGLNLNNLGTVHLRQGHLNQARTCFEESAALHRETGALAALVLPLDNLGTIALWQARLADAEAFYREALDVASQTGNIPQAQHARVGLAEVALVLGRYDEALALALEALDLARQGSDPLMESTAAGWAGIVLSAQGSDEEAAQRLRGALDALPEDQHGPAQTEQLSYAAGLECRAGRLAEARSMAERAVAGSQLPGRGVVESTARAHLAAILIASGDLAGAAEQARLAVRLGRQFGTPLREALGLVMLGHATGDPAHRRAALEIYTAAGVPQPMRDDQWPALR
ncbi:AfsR/SARP family transcriptional regulator [Longispora albida]|uniref:AfsR/SARP family transcriptional regulator n=1 Tax=Longispora albida TaxID=203523 RepID=UPI00039ECD1B|nr:BTAD domain-containing putative transcriptional regulator [Longispora albida]